MAPNPKKRTSKNVLHNFEASKPALVKRCPSTLATKFIDALNALEIRNPMVGPLFAKSNYLVVFLELKGDPRMILPKISHCSSFLYPPQLIAE